MLSRFRQSEDDSERSDASAAAGLLARCRQAVLPPKSLAAAGVAEGLASAAADVPRPRTPSRGRPVEWERRFDRRCADVRDVAATDAGYVFVGTTGAAADRGPDFWVAETDTEGRERWSRTFGSDGVDIARAVRPAVDGGYVLAGTTSSAAEADDGAVLAHLGPEGELGWRRTFGGDGFDVCRALARDGTDGYVLAGGTQSDAADGQDAWLLGVSADGTRRWSRTFSRSQGDIASDVRPTRGGGFVVVGQTFGKGTDCWLIDTDGEGRRRWDRTHSYGESDVARSVVETADGGYIIVGTTSDGSARSSVWIVKVDADGEREWSRTVGGSGMDIATGVAQAGDGGVVVAGETTSFSDGPSALLLAVDADGTCEWIRTIRDDSAAHAGPIRIGDAFVIAGGASDRAWTSDDRGWAVKLPAHGSEQRRRPAATRT